MVRILINSSGGSTFGLGGLEARTWTLAWASPLGCCLDPLTYHPLYVHNKRARTEHLQTQSDGYKRESRVLISQTDSHIER